MCEIVFISIYLISVAIHIRILWKENGKHFFKVGDVIDNIDFYMVFPILNTLFLIILGVFIIIIKLKLNIIWEKFINIKLK